MTPDLAETFARDEGAVGNWVSLPEPTVAELFASMAVDFVVLDMEHTPMDLSDVAAGLRGIDAAPGDAGAVVRVPGHDPDRIKRVLDLGVDGLMVPMVESADEAAAIVEACRYPPDGIRGVGPGRGAGYGRHLTETVAADDESFAIVAQIESPTAVEAAGAIAAVDGIDALFVGPTDLSVATGSFGAVEEADDESAGEAADAPGDEANDSLFALIDDVLDSAAAADTPVGTIRTGAAPIERCVDAGFDFLAVGYDVQYLTEGSQRALDVYDSASEE